MTRSATTRNCTAALPAEVHFLTLDEALAIHERMLRDFGGSPGVRDMGLLESALHRPSTGYYETLAAMSKLYCSEVAQRCVHKAVQIHGGYGLMKEYDVERFYRDQRLLEIGEGTSEIQRIVIARRIGL